MHEFHILKLFHQFLTITFVNGIDVNPIFLRSTIGIEQNCTIFISQPTSKKRVKSTKDQIDEVGGTLARVSSKFGFNHCIALARCTKGSAESLSYTPIWSATFIAELKLKQNFNIDITLISWRPKTIWILHCNLNWSTCLIIPEFEEEKWES